MKTFYKKMGAMAVISALALIPFGCTQNSLKLQPSYDTDATYFTSEDHFNRTAIGVYAKLTDLFWYNAGQGNTVTVVPMLPGDDLTSSDKDEFEIFSKIQPSSGRLAYFYSANYQLVNRANQMLEQLAKVAPGVITTPKLADHLKGEALFLRAYAYYNLWNNFGFSPLVLKTPTVTSDLYPGNSKGTQLLDQSIADLQAAAPLLPPNWDALNLGRVTSNSAYAFLGKCLVFRGTVNKAAADFQAAISAFGQISASVQLLPNWDDNFAFDTENNAESLFEFQASKPSNIENSWLSNDFVDPAVGATAAYWGMFDGKGYGKLYNKNGYGNFAAFGTHYTATAKLAAIYQAGDPRLVATLDSNNHINKYVTRNVNVNAESINNPRILRFADVKLLWAEAIIQSGGSTAAAIGLINDVRSRARAWGASSGLGDGVNPANRDAGVTDKATIMQWIMDERLMELACESQRWYDLRRWALGGQLTLNNAFFSSASPADMGFDLTKHLYFPIPTNETQQNINIRQNPGY